MIRVRPLAQALVVAAALGSAAWAEDAPAPAADAPQARATEPDAEARNCVSLTSIRSTRVLDDQTILFEMNGKETLVNRLPHRCPGLRREKAFGYKTSISQLCSQDIIWVVESGGRYPGAHCGLGKFEAYVPPADASKPGKRVTMEPAKTE